MFQDEIIKGDMPPLVSASVLHSGTESYSSDVSGSEEKPKASMNQIEALIEQEISDDTQVRGYSKISIINSYLHLRDEFLIAYITLISFIDGTTHTQWFYS